MGNSKVSYEVPTFGVDPAKPGGFKDWMKPTPDSDFSGAIDGWDCDDEFARPAKEKKK